MKTNIPDKKTIATTYVVFFVICSIYSVINDVLLVDLRVGFFVEHLDFSRFIYNRSGLWELVNDSFLFASLFDIIYHLLPVIYLMLMYKSSQWQYVLAWTMVVYNIIYSIALYATLQYGNEPYYVFVLMPLLFTARTKEGYLLSFNFVRYCFLYILLSAGLFKIFKGGGFFLYQMSGALLEVHQSLLLSDPDYWYSELISFIVSNPYLGYPIFFTAVCLQLAFGIGYFTTKYDRHLQFLFVAFLLMDMALMRINYLQTGIFICLLWQNSNGSDVLIKQLSKRNYFRLVS